MDVFDVVYHLSQAPTALGWAMCTAGMCALAWLHGRTGR